MANNPLIGWKNLLALGDVPTVTTGTDSVANPISNVFNGFTTRPALPITDGTGTVVILFEGLNSGDGFGAVGFGAAVDYLAGIGMESIEKYERELTSYALEKIRGVKNLTLYGPEDARCGVLSFNLGEIHAHDVAQYLDSKMVAVRAGHHCAHPLMRKLGVTSTARASLYLYNERDDIDILVDSLSECGDFFTHGL